MGISATVGLGPVFFLIISRSTVYGRLNGLATACGAALADGLFFFLALMGALNVMSNYKSFTVAAEVISGLAIVLFGIIMLRTKQPPSTIALKERPSTLLAFLQSFFLTLLSPFVAIFFMFASIQVVPSNIHPSLHNIILGAGTVTLGSLLGLGSIALSASSLRNALNQERIARIGFYSGILFIGIGTYLVIDSIWTIIKAFA